MKQSRRNAARRRERLELGASFLLSVLLHLLLLLLFTLVLLLKPKISRPAKEPELADVPVEMTFLPESAPSPTPAPTPETVFVDSAALTEAEQPPEQTRFESDRDTLAASPQQGHGDSALPTQEGREADYIELADQQLSLGDVPRPSAPPTQQTEPAPTPEPTPEPTPQPTPEPTPLAEDALALRRPPEVRRAEPVAPQNVRQEVRRPEPVRPAQPGFQPERRVTRIEGGVSNRGPASVAAMATPLGRYKKALSDAIGSRWYFYVRNEISLLAVGTTTIRFQVLASGRVTGIQVLSNTSNESFAAISIRSIMDAEIPPIPPDVAELLENNRIEVDYTFSIIAN